MSSTLERDLFEGGVPPYFLENLKQEEKWRELIGRIERSWVVLSNPRDPQGQPSKTVQHLLESEAESLGSGGGIWVASSGSESHGQSRKWIALPWSQLKASAEAVNRRFQVRPGDRWLHALPLFHVGGFQILTRAFLAGPEVDVIPGLPREFGWDPHFYHATAHQQNATLSALVPTQLFDLVRDGLRAPASLRALVIGGAALDEDLLQKALELGWPVFPSYGMTETASQIATAATVGSMDLKLLDHAEVQVEPDSAFRVKGSSVSPLVVHLDPLGQVVSRGDPRDVEGYYRTSDRGELQRDAQGSTFLRGIRRESDEFKRMGEWVSLSHLRREWEKVLRIQQIQGEIQDWELALEVDSRAGVRVVLLVQVASDTPNEGWIAAWRKKQLDFAPFERLEDVVVGRLPLPRSALGKIQKSELAGWIQQTVAGNPKSRVSLR